MTRATRRQLLLNLLVLAVTIVFVDLTLVVGRPMGGEPIALEVGDRAPQDFVAPRFVAVPDEEATQAERERAMANTPAVYSEDLDVSNRVRRDLAAFFAAIREAAFEDPDPSATTTTTAAPTTTTTSGEAPPGEAGGEAGAETTTTTTTVAPTTTTTTLPRRDLAEQVDLVKRDFAFLGNAVDVFVRLYNEDLDRVAAGEEPIFDDLESQVRELLNQQLARGIRPSELTSVRNSLLTQPPPIFIPGLDAEQEAEVASAVGELLAGLIQANELLDEEATRAAREAAAAAVEPVVREFVASQPIVRAGEVVDAVELQAIQELGLLETEEVTGSRLGIAILGALTVLMAAFFLWRVAPGQWSQPKHFAMLGVLLEIAALISRLPELIAVENPALGFMLPAVMLGYMAAILYNPRTAVLMAVPVVTFTGISTGDVALTVFAAAATVAPVAFVSSVSSRRELRLAVGVSAIVLAPLAGATSWVFRGADTALEAAAFGLMGGVVAGLVAQGLLSFLENLFKLTTSLTLLDLVDRNHPALRLLEEKAPGTFNHSILVGTLAGKAARAIGANPLLAQAAAFYHDLGKTENPHFFIENQFGAKNPHDDLRPEQSAEIIRRHVTDGLRLAREYGIPPDVAEGIRAHHGTGLMRYFYHKALEQNPNVDPALFRHTGEKPKGKEMAILMLSDAVEGAARALAQHEDPTPEKLRELVENVVREKLEDGQLDESDLTFGDLTKVKDALVDALAAYYHTRIPYPGFPGARAPEATSAAEPVADAAAAAPDAGAGAMRNPAPVSNLVGDGPASDVAAVPGNGQGTDVAAGHGTPEDRGSEAPTVEEPTPRR